MGNLEVLYKQGREGFVPDPTDNPENIWFYAAWRGMEAVCVSLGIMPQDLHNQLHQALCQSSGHWSLIMEDLRHSQESLVLPEKPRLPYTSDYEPVYDSVDIEKQAKVIFGSQFKRAFPGKALNSKLAREKWEEVQEKARKLANQSLSDSYLAWKVREAEREHEYDQRMAQWRNACAEVNHIKEILQRILAAGGEEENAGPEGTDKSNKGAVCRSS